MQTGLGGTSWYSSALAGLIVGSLLFVAGYWMVISRQKAELEARRQHLAELEQKLVQGRDATRDLPRSRDELRRRQRQLDRLLRVLPVRRNTSDLMRRIRRLTEQGNLDLTLFRPGDFVERDFYSEWPIAIQVDGTYHSLGVLFDRISHLPRIVNVDELRITPLPEASARGDRTVHATFTAKTFIYTDSAAAERGGEAP